MPRFKPSIRDEMASLAQWSELALCRRGHTPGDWDTIKVNKNTFVDDKVRAAKESCLSCPVMMDCLIHGIVFEKEDQIWGGLTDEERARWAAQNGMVAA